jgi:hypothetical protein
MRDRQFGLSTEPRARIGASVGGKGLIVGVGVGFVVL